MRRRLVCLFTLGLTLAAPLFGRAAAGLRLTYLGTAGWEITDGRTVLLVDPYLTRAKYRTPTDPVLATDSRQDVSNGSVVPPDTKTIDAHISRANAILVTHGHPDHTLDVAYIARRTGATVVGSQSVHNLEHALGVDDRQLTVVTGNESLTFNDVVVTPIRSRHGISDLPPSLTEAGDPVQSFAAGLQPPFSYGQYAAGPTLAYDIRIGGHEILVFGSMNFNERELAGLRPDIALIGAMPERALITDYTARLLTVLGQPRLVLPTHWDAFNYPYGASQQMAIDRVQPFLAEVKAASPASRTFVPELIAPILVDDLPGMSSPRPAAGEPIVKFYTGDLWLNLHHFLYVLGRAQDGMPDASRPEVADAPKDQERGLATVSAKEQADWRAAVNAYAADLSKRDAVSDPQLITITRAMAAAGDDVRVDDPAVPQALSAVLRQAATAYRHAWWPAHHRANLAWMSSTRALVDRHGDAILKFITHAYQLPWPAGGYPVHVTAYANWAGAYSTDGPLLVISSLDPDGHGLPSLETVFHEAMHQWDDPIGAKLGEIGRPLGKTVPAGLTHAMIWMTAGEAVRNAVPDYTPLAEAGGIWLRGANPRMRPPLEASWLPYLKGAGSRDDALLALMRVVGR